MSPRRVNPASTYQMSIADQSVQFDADAFDNVIRGQGVLLTHQRAMRCPSGMRDKNDSIRKVHSAHPNCSNGFIYYDMGSFQGLLTGNGLNAESRDIGNVDSSSAQLTLPRRYNPVGDEPTDRILVAPMDRFYFADESIIVANWELVDSSISGSDRLSFPAIKINKVVDSNLKEYSPSDYRIVKGNISWVNDSPGLDPETGLPVVYSVHYYYRPFFYVKSMGHEIRVTMVEDALGNRTLEKMPQSCTVQREYVFLNEEPQEDASSARQWRQPSDGSFGPR